MEKKLSPQKEKIVDILRDLRWHCGREWLDGIKDDRKRISELNDGYMKEKGWEIVGEPCKGAVCGVEKCPLYKRRAQKLMQVSNTNQTLDYWRNLSKEAVEAFDNNTYLRV